MTITRLLLCLALGLWAAIANTSPAQQQPPQPMPDQTVRLETFFAAHVTHLQFSPDHRWIVAVYFRPATNNSGSNWASGAGIWDLSTGKSTVVLGAVGPLAISPDSRMCAMGLEESHGLVRQYDMPDARLKVWMLGEDKPLALPRAKSDEQPESRVRRVAPRATPLAVAFHPAGKHVVSLSVGGELQWRPLDPLAPSQLIEEKLIPTDESIAWLSPFYSRAELEFDREGKVLSLHVPHQGGLTNGVRASWRVDVEVARFDLISHEILPPAKPAPRKDRERSFVSADGKLHANVDLHGVITVSDSAGKLLHTLRIHQPIESSTNNPRAPATKECGGA